MFGSTRFSCTCLMAYVVASANSINVILVVSGGCRHSALFSKSKTYKQFSPAYMWLIYNAAVHNCTVVMNIILTFKVTLNHAANYHVIIIVMVWCHMLLLLCCSFVNWITILNLCRCSSFQFTKPTTMYVNHGQKWFNYINRALHRLKRTHGDIDV